MLRRTESWADGRRRLRLHWRRAARFRTPVLVVSAALFGALASAAVLVGFWDRETGRRQAVETKLATSQHRAKELGAANERLLHKLRQETAATRRLEQRAAVVEQGAATLRAAAQTVLLKNTALVAAAGSLHGRGGSLEQRAAAVSKLADTLGNDLVAVLSYVTNTSAGSLDPAYLKAQLDYLKPAVAQVRSAADALAVDADGYAGAVDAFAGDAASYAAALRQLARQRGR